MRINHLEIENFGDWLNKQMIRGEMNTRIGLRTGYKRLTPAMRWAIFRLAAKKNGYGFGRAGRLLLLLWLGNIYYKTGGLQARWKRS
jgi:hypothetical protein